MSEAQHENEQRQPLLHSVEITEVYPVIHMIKADAEHYIDTPLSYEALTAPDLTYTLIRPLEEKYNALQRKGNLSVVFCLLLNRAYFLRDHHLTTSALSRSRAALCELLAIKTIREHGGNMMELSLALTTSWPVYSGADPGLMERAREERDDLEERVGNAIEIAIISQSKRFIKSSACQKVIDGIWSGKIVYPADSSRSILSDTYKRNPIHFYDPHKAPLLDHYRLKVPAVRSVLEYVNFLILFVLFVLALEFSERARINVFEGIFMVYALGFTLEKVAAMQEHGIKVYFKGTWNGFDLAFVTLYCTYAVMRLWGVYQDKSWAKETGIDFLAVIAVFMFPRLAFVTLKNNLMVLSLRAMIMQFVALMLIAAFCFGGFLYALWTLSRGSAGYSAGTIAWWMLDLWFGLDAGGFQNATDFHPVFGPFMMITYACLSNTLLLTVLVSILSHTFTTINDDAAAEAMFRRAVSTIEGVKADSLFSYQPPVNLLALCIMLPASYILTPRWFHKFNVFMIRLTSFPILLLIAVYERQAKRSGSITFYETMTSAAEKVFDTLPRNLKRLTWFEGLMAGSDADIDAVFELESTYDESALDMDETTPLGPMGDQNGTLRSRRPSQMSRRQVSTSSARSNGLSPTSLYPNAHVPSASSSPRKNERSPTPTPPIGNIPLPRARINSLMTGNLALSQSTPSPLAQLFQPLIVDENNIPYGFSDYQLQQQTDQSQQQESQSQEHISPTSTEPMVSYGPASRRRLSSMHRRTGSAAPSLPAHPSLPTILSAGSELTTSPPETAGAQPMRRFPPGGAGVAARLAADNMARQALSESPDENKRARRDPRETASQIEEEEEDGEGMMERLDRMEAAQKRIEDMLRQMSENMGGGSRRS
ncbi:hypothetical protein EUX98_g1732 [Antrodiella citrinella]|uniref:Ion transport domain-containing protein n=1 Tax=Antrodiella citrinella TaxID=2447956 RepID=A0A4S4N0R3_9APHY|nr:hypothetical protein EUX98_g1732 [Antrodiella citrinella]